MNLIVVNNIDIGKEKENDRSSIHTHMSVNLFVFSTYTKNMHTQRTNLSVLNEMRAYI